MSIFSSIFLVAPESLPEGGGDLLGTILGLVVTFATLGGGLWLVWGVVVLAGALKDKNGPALQSAVWQIVGGGLIVTAAQLFNWLV